MLDLLPAAVAVLKDRKAVWWNQAGARVVGARPEDAAGMDVERWYTNPEDFRRVGTEAYACLSRGEEYVTTVEFCNVQGRKFRARIRGRAFDASNMAEGSIWILEDIQSLHVSEESLRTRDAELQAILSSTDDGILVVSQSGRVIQANSRMYQLWNIPADVIETQDDKRMIECALAQLKDPGRFIRRVNELYASTDVSADELELKDGRVFERTTAPLMVAGKHAGRIWTFRDVTVRVKAQSALRVSEARLTSTLGALTDLLFVWDASGRFVEAHCPPGLSLFAPPSEFMGKHYRDVLPPKVAESLSDAFRALARTGEPQIFEYSTAIDGRERWWSASLSRRPDLHGANSGVVGLMREITELKAAEREIRASRENYLGLFNTVTESIFVHGLDGAFIDVNEGACKLYGYTRSELIGKTSASIAAPGRNNIDGIMALAKEVFETGAPGEFEFFGRRKSGEVLVKQCLMHRGTYFGRTVLITTGHDVTEARASTERIREQAALLDVAQDAILVLDLERQISYLNRGAERLYGVRRNEALGKRYDSIAYRDLPAGFEAEWNAMLLGGEFSRERRQSTRARGEITVQERAALVRDEQGHPKSVLIVVTDLTESKRLESQFLRAQRMESLGSLAAGIAHDLNNVLTPILISAGVLADSKLPAQEMELVQLLAENARRGADIVRQLLLYGRGSDTPRASMSVRRVVRDMEQIMRETFPREITLAVDIPADLWVIEGDRTQIHQVILNLCVNARDAMPCGGTLTLRTENILVDEPFAAIHTGAKAGSHIVVRVKDTGVGIAREHLDKIFDPFFTTKPVGQGTGLGLASAIGIVRGHGGFITVESAPGSGTEFSVYLPAHEANAEAIQSEERSNLRGRGELVLLVDDEAGVRDATRSVLKRFGYDVVTANDGAAALEIFAQRADMVQLVITDIMMPGMDGKKLIRALQGLRPSLPILAISGVPGHRTELEAASGPFFKFLPKPFVFDALLDATRELIDRKKSS